MWHLNPLSVSSELDYAVLKCSYTCNSQSVPSSSLLKRQPSGDILETSPLSVWSGSLLVCDNGAWAMPFSEQPLPRLSFFTSWNSLGVWAPRASQAGWLSHVTPPLSDRRQGVPCISWSLAPCGTPVFLASFHTSVPDCLKEVICGISLWITHPPYQQMLSWGRDQCQAAAGWGIRRCDLSGSRAGGSGDIQWGCHPETPGTRSSPLSMCALSPDTSCCCRGLTPPLHSQFSVAVSRLPLLAR